MPWEKSFDIDHTLDKATRLFWSRGYDATSMQALVDEMGINRGSLYDTYGDKRSLFIAALRRYDQQFRRNRLAELERKHTPKAAIKALFKSWIQIALDDSGRSGCFLTNTALEVAAHDAEIGAIVATSQRDTEKIFVRLIRNGQVSGEISKEIEPRQSARSLLATLIGLLVLARSRPESALLTSIADSALEQLE